MAAATKFQQFVADKANGVHNFSSDIITVALTLTAPVATNSVLTDLTEIAYTNLSARALTTTSSTQTAGVYKYIAEDLTLTASGAVAPFRYVAFYNDTAASDNLIGFYDYGSTVNMSNLETFLIDIDQVNGLLSDT